MLRLLSTLLVVVLVANPNCWSPPCSVSTDGADAALTTGRWQFVLQSSGIVGDCPDLDERQVFDPLMSAELDRTSAGWVHLDLAGLHMEGDQAGDQLYAQGWSATGFVRDDPHAAPLSLGLTLDAWLGGPDFMEGELYILLDQGGRDCSFTVPFEASLVAGTQGAPEVCNEPVPADPANPPDLPEDAEVWCG